jgi:hypothetical protein
VVGGGVVLVGGGVVGVRVTVGVVTGGVVVITGVNGAEVSGGVVVITGGVVVVLAVQPPKAIIIITDMMNSAENACFAIDQ